jgi:hypothetical protein
MNRDSSGGRETRLRATRRPGFESRQGQEISPIQTASYTVGTRDCVLGVKRPGYEADHSPSSTAEVKNSGVISPLPHMPS